MGDFSIDQNVRRQNGDTTLRSLRACSKISDPHLGQAGET
jgi:hypothetical protein